MIEEMENRCKVIREARVAGILKYNLKNQITNSNVY